jgi:hypothetical protein
MKTACTVLCLGLSTLSCLASTPQAGEATPYVPGIRIIKAAQASQLHVEGQPFDFPFGNNQDGTKLVIDFLDEAKRAGARYVSDIRIVLVARRGGSVAACSTSLLPFSKKEKEIVPHVEPARVETRMVSRPVTQTVTEYTSECRMVSHPVSSTETSYQYQYDYYSKTSRSVPVTRYVTRYESRNECRMVPVTRTVTRYEHQLETRYIPPRLTYLQAHYTDFDLVEGVPVCAPADSKVLQERLPHRIRGIIYRERR